MLNLGINWTPNANFNLLSVLLSISWYLSNSKLQHSIPNCAVFHWGLSVIQTPCLSYSRNMSFTCRRFFQHSTLSCGKTNIAEVLYSPKKLFLLFIEVKDHSWRVTVLMNQLLYNLIYVEVTQIIIFVIFCTFTRGTNEVLWLNVLFQGL